jgi:hypothetical protein
LQHGTGQRTSIGKFAAAWTIGADEIRIAKLAHRARPVPFKAAPQITSGKSQEHGGASRLRAFALKGRVDFFNCVHRGLC